MNHPDPPRSQGRHTGGPTDLRPEAGTEISPMLEQASLEQVIGRFGPMPPQRTAVVGLAVLDQLVAMHNRGMLHGDVRPGAVLLGPYDQIILTGPTLPSQAFTAPEGVTSPAADLWSLGATLYTAVEGRPPSPGGALDNAGPIAPVLFSLLSGDPTQRPAPAILRTALLDIAHNHGDTTLREPALPGDTTLREPAPSHGTMRDIPLASLRRENPTGPTERSGLRTGVLVPRPIVALTGTLLVAMAVTIGILLAPMLGGSGESDPADSAEPAGAKGRFASAPRACSMLDDKQAAEVVPEFRSSEVEVSECNWLNSQDWRKPSTDKFDLRVRLVAQKQDGSEVMRAKEYLSGKKNDLAEKVQFATPKPAPPKDLKGIGEEAFSSGSHSSINLHGGTYKVTLVFRVSNLIAEIEYERTGVKTDPDGKIEENAEKVAHWIVESLKTNG
jgi:serine/threonine protein kinase